MMRLTYIWHDCFVYSDSEVVIVFDFWKDPLCDDGDMPLFLKVATAGKQVYVVVSHHHKDHYTKKIFEWSRFLPDIRYILSKDVARYSRHILNPDSIYAGVKPAPRNVTVLAPGGVYEDSHIVIEAFGSTDIGNSYAIRTGGRTIFHAGDLNAWIWKDESSEEEVKEAINLFSSILERIALRCPEFDIAMFPVDSRIGADYFTGAKMFLERINVSHFFPMHFGLGDSPEEQLRHQLDAADIDNYINPTRGECITLQAPYSVFFKA